MSCSSPHRYLHPFPTRRSSDLGSYEFGLPLNSDRGNSRPVGQVSNLRACSSPKDAHVAQVGNLPHGPGISRSEEHTSELQSRVDLVCRLLLEKKKHTITALYSP